MVPILQVRNLELREVKSLAQGHSARRWLNRDSNQACQILKPVPLISLAIDGFLRIEGPADPLGRESLRSGALDSLGSTSEGSAVREGQGLRTRR